MHQAPPSPAVVDAIRRANAKWRAHRTAVFDQAVPFSWPRLVASIVTYLLLLSDVVRSGLGIRALENAPPIEPNVNQMYGPWAYPVFQVWSNESAADIPVWTYRSDTTSIAWRAFAEYFDAKAFPMCLRSATACPDETLGRAVIFQMMDELAVSVAAMGKQQPGSKGLPPSPVGVTIRSESAFGDLLHHHILPQFFVPAWRRTNQALYYPPELLMSRPSFDLCAFSTAQPTFCSHLWANFRLSCHEYCSFDQVSHDISQRFQALQTEYPDALIDLTTLSSDDDCHQNTGGHMFLCYRGFDLTTILRVRRCNGTRDDCVTVIVDDFRNEGGFTTHNVGEWYAVVVVLRCIAQSYFAARLVLLFAGCYMARRAEPALAEEPATTVIFAALRTMARIPCQGIVYGSVFPTLCYVMAHCIDAPMVCRIISEKFTTMTGGEVEFKFIQLCLLLSMQMRNLWLLGLVLQVAVRFATTGQWSPVNGVLGLPDYSISALAALSIMAQYRDNSFRVANIFRVDFVGSTPRHTAQLRGLGSSRNSGSVTLEGALIDLKCLVVLILLAVIITAILWTCLSWYYGRKQRRVGILVSRTPVPYSAGTLWPATAFCIYWDADVFPYSPDHHRFSFLHRVLNSRGSRVQSVGQYIRRVVPAQTTPLQVIRNNTAPHKDGLQQPVCHNWPAHPAKRLRFVKAQLENVHDRSRDANAVVALMNVYAMTDPWTWLTLRWLGGRTICYLRHKPSGRICCVPKVTWEQEVQSSVPWHEMEVVQTVNSMDMSWSDLLHCG